MLRFMTCGSVDDGKSTLLGHLLYEAKLLFSDQIQALELDSKMGSREGELDYSLLLDGLVAEREQGITIDVAYRYFSTKQRSFIVADTPGHEQYTRNMAVGASFADLAIILVDAVKGIQMQTKRHIRICALMGIKHLVLAVNKMDLLDYDRHRFQHIEEQFKDFVADFNLSSIQAIPVSATTGDNVVDSSSNTPWYDGEPLLTYLEQIDIHPPVSESAFVMPVQRVSRPSHRFRGLQGQIEAGIVEVGDQLHILPGSEQARVKSIHVGDQPAERAAFGQPVTIELDREVDASRGCVLVKEGETVDVTDMFAATLLWMDDAQLIAGRSYLAKIGTTTLPATVMNVKYKLDIHTGKRLMDKHIMKNEIAVCEISLAEKAVSAPFTQLEALGGLILMDRITNQTVAGGVIEHPLRRAANVFWQHTDITREMRAQQKAQKPITIWFTGLSGSGKSTLANEVEKRLVALGKHTMLLDGDNVRQGLNRNLGFTEADRVENIRRIAEVAKLMNDAGLITLTSFISPYAKDREQAKAIIGEDFIEIYVSTPLAECEKRDVKGLYKKARKGEIPNFTGITSPYEPPINPAIEVDTSQCTLEEAVDFLMERIKHFL